MKKYLSVIGIIAVVVFISCEKIIDVEPTYYISGDEAINDKSGVYEALTGIYDGLQQTGIYGRYMVLIPDVAADNLDWKGTTQEYGQFENNTILADNTIIESIWSAHYNTLNRINFLLYKINDIDDLGEEEKNDVKAQCYTLRALLHFNLVRMFGPVPVKTQPTLDLGSDLNGGRAPVSEVYQLIQDDLENSYGKIIGTNAGYVTNGAVTALQAKVAMYLGDYTTAREKATEVINSGYQLEGSYADLFGNTVGKEAVFTILFNEQDGNRLAEYFSTTAMGGRYEVAPAENLIGSFEEGDARLAASIAGSPPYCTKYADLVTMANNVHCIRLAELYLLRAEAEARLQGSREAIRNDINMIRERAQLPVIETDDYDGLLRDIENEHRAEFAFEGHRWFELVRTGRAMEVLPTVTDINQLLFPIPQVELQNNTNPDMFQNPGY